MHLAVELPGCACCLPRSFDVARPDSRSVLPRPGFNSYARLARTAERGLFDFLLLADHREDHNGHPDQDRHRDQSGGNDGHHRNHPLPSCDRHFELAPTRTIDHALDSLTVLNALAAVTSHLGLAAALNTAGREPYDLARRIVALDQLSGGRAACTAALVPELSLPRSPQGRPVALHDLRERADLRDRGNAHSDPPDALSGGLDVVLVGTQPARPSPHPGTLVLASLCWLPDDAGSPTALPGLPDLPEPGSARRPWPAEVFTGQAHALAGRLDHLVRSGAVDGFVLRPGPAPDGHGLDRFVDMVVPLLQERGALRTDYRGMTLRDHLGLPHRDGAP